MEYPGRAPAHPDGPPRLVADGALLFITMLWGLTFVAVKNAVAAVPVFTFLALRFGLAAPVLAGVLAWRRAGRPPRGRGEPVPEEGGGLLAGGRGARLGLLTGLLLFAGYALQTLGLQYTTPGKAGFITGLSVVLVPVLDALAFRRPQDRTALAGVALAAAGMALMFLEPADLSVRRGDLLVLGCALAFGAHVTAVAHFGRRVELVGFTMWQVLAVAALSAGAATLEGWSLAGVDREVAATLLLTGPVVSGLLLLLQVWGQRHTSATHAALIFATEPIFAAIAGVALAGERFGPRGAAGAALILAGMLLAEAGRLYRGVGVGQKGLRAASRTP
ncbi:MAG TPA: DMT family transporter [Limnochordales bacterium]